jgi:predicted DNA-binding ribbon-helix-helix protein
MPRQPTKRSVYRHGYRTCVTLENDFWDALKEIAAAQGTTISLLIATIDNERPKGSTNLSSASFGARLAIAARCLRSPSNCGCLWDTIGKPWRLA